MVRSLPPAEFECHVVVPAEPPLRADFEAAGATIHIVPMRRISTSHGLLRWLAYAVGWPVAVTRLAHLVRHLHVDVVHSNSLHSWYGWAAARFARRPHVWHAREIVVQSGAALRVERFLARRFATRVVCSSQAIADQLNPRNIVVIHDTPDPKVFHPSRAGRARAGISVPDDAPLVGVVGRIDTWKGVDVLLDAWPRLKAAVPTAHLAVAGGTVQGKERYADELGAHARALPDVHWLGELDQEGVAGLLADLDVIAVPSTEPEPYGFAVVEALMSGAPVVATDAGGPREMLALATPDAGRLVPPRDADALADALAATLQDAQPTVPESRATRTPLIVLPPGDVAEIFRAAATRS
jgi:glycosyltransferase involved in cell wall biosynthesis